MFSWPCRIHIPPRAACRITNERSLGCKQTLERAPAMHVSLLLLPPAAFLTTRSFYHVQFYHSSSAPSSPLHPPSPPSCLFAAVMPAHTRRGWLAAHAHHIQLTPLPPPTTSSVLLLTSSDTLLALRAWTSLPCSHSGSRQVLVATMTTIRNPPPPRWR